MPLYDYKCAECGHIFEVMQKITEEPLKYCPECKGEIKRLISAAGIIFKGSGFHVTDYKKSSKPDISTSKPAKKENNAKETKTTETKKAEAKETKNSEAVSSPPRSK